MYIKKENKKEKGKNTNHVERRPSCLRMNEQAAGGGNYVCLFW